MSAVPCVSFPAPEASLNYTPNCDDKFPCPRGFDLLPELMHWRNLMAEIPLALIQHYVALDRLFALAETVCSLFHDERL